MSATKLWEVDPVFKGLRDEYLESFPERALALEKILSKSEWTPEDRTQLRFVVHKIAGLAGSYGLGAFGDICGTLDDAWGFWGKSETLTEADMREAHELVRLALLEVHRTRQDPSELGKQAVVQRITSCVESLLAESTS